MTALPAPSLSERLADGLDEAFPDLVDAHGAMVLTLATRLTDVSTGEDITQEVFLRAYRALGGYAKHRIPAIELRPWLATITRNLVRNEYRRRSRKATVPLPAAHVGPETAGADVAVEAIASSERIDALLEPLSDPQREAIVLRHIVGLPMREVALTMACPEGTAKSHLSRGLSQLRTSLTETAITESNQPHGERR